MKAKNPAKGLFALQVHNVSVTEFISLIISKFPPWLRDRVGRYFKFLVPYLRVRLGLSYVNKDPAIIIREAKKEKRSHFRAKVYTVPQLLELICNASDKDLARDDLRELVETLPLLLNHVAETQQKWYTAKMENHPFDVWMAPERLVEINDGNVDIYRGWYIQTKRLVIHPPRHLSLNEWVDHFEKFIAAKITNIDFGFIGHVHFYNRIALSGPERIEDLNSSLKKLRVPYNKQVDSISLSVELVNDKSETTTLTQYIYPVVGWPSILDLDFEKAKRVYMAEEPIRDLFALKQKMFR